VTYGSVIKVEPSYGESEVQKMNSFDSSSEVQKSITLVPTDKLLQVPLP
jgi:hypothetical protein